MLLSVAVNYPCQTWRVRHYGPGPAHSFTRPPPTRHPLPQTVLDISVPGLGTQAWMPATRGLSPIHPGQEHNGARGSGLLSACPTSQMLRRRT